MKRMYPLLLLLCYAIVLLPGCGKKGDPAIPVVPQPLPIEELNARVEGDGVILSWVPPTTYDTEKALELKDIRAFTVFRKIEAPLANRWDFSQSTEGWAAAGKTLPVKRYKGALRTASDQSLLILRSPEDLAIPAQTNRYIRLKLWANNSQQGYITFITSQDTTADKDVDLTFEPAVHTSYYTVQSVFNTIKSKSFPLVTSPSNVAHEYLIDMQRIPAWQGTIKQVGILLRNSKFVESEVEENESEESILEVERPLAELGLESIEFLPDIDEKASLYESPPWMFLDDEEGWKAFQPGRILGTSGGVLYAQGIDTVVLLSKPGQSIQVNKNPLVRIRMNVTDGEKAYLVLRKRREELFRSFESISMIDESYTVIPIPLQEHGTFSTYTIDLREYIDLSDITEDSEGQQENGAVDVENLREPENEDDTRPSQRIPTLNQAAPISQDKEAITEPEGFQEISGIQYITQIGLVFPSLDVGTTRHILLDYIDIASNETEPEYRASRLTQENIPSIVDIERDIQAQLLAKAPDFDMPYDELPEEKDFTPVEQIQLVEISPKDPTPAKIVKMPPKESVSTEIDDTSPKEPIPVETDDISSKEPKPTPAEIERDQFVLVDTGDFIVEDSEGEESVAALEYGKRYAYQVEVTDRKKRKSPPANAITVEFVRLPSPPENLSAEPEDEEITLTWERPLFTTDGKKIRALAGYQIFRSLTSGDYPVTPITRTSASQTTFIDKNLSNRKRYYYTIQTIASAASDIVSQEMSEEVSAIPIDNTPPASPNGVVGIYINDIVNLHWNQVQSGDFGGFNVYRSDTATGTFHQLNTEPILKASYKDTTVEAKKRYYYYVTSFDDEISPNESEPSKAEPVETFPLD